MKYITLISLIVLANPVFSQDNYLRKAINAYQGRDFQSARINIDSAAHDETLSKNPRTWYVMGFIYKDLYKKEPELDTAFLIRETATEAFGKLSGMEGSDEYLPDAYVNLKYIAVTFYNDAVLLLDSGDFELSKIGFELFKKNLLRSGDTAISINDQETSYYLNLAARFGALHKADSTDNNEFFKKAIETYEYLLALDSTHIKANYNLAVLYYNEAVKIINELDYDEVDIFAFSEVEDRSISYFKLSLPYMEITYALDSSNVSTIEGLSGIYFGLREFDKSDYYKDLVESIRKE